MSTDDQGNEIGKLFVGGLHQTTTNDNLKLYFSNFGEVIEASVMMDHKTGRSRGFGYVRYADNDSVQKVMQNSHNLDGKDIDPKPCNINMKGRSRRSLKIFVGGIAPEHNEETLRDFFKQFGNVTELTLMRDQSGHRHRGFAFVAFDDETIVKQLISDHFLQIGNKQVEIKPMEPQINRVGNGGQWPQWTSASPAGWPTQPNWTGWTQAPTGAPAMWDQGAPAWGTPANWGNTNGAVNGLSHGQEMMANAWDPSQMWNGGAMAATAGLQQHTQANNNSWGPMTNSYLDQSHSGNQWSAATLAGGYGLAGAGGSDWRAGVAPQTQMQAHQSYGQYKR